MNWVILGGGGHAKVVASILARLDGQHVIGYLDLSDRGPLLGAPHLGSDDQLPILSGEHGQMTLALGIGMLCAEHASLRSQLIARVKRAGLDLPPFVAASAVLGEEVVLGEATVVMEGAVVGPDVLTGAGVTVNSRASIDHDCRLGAQAHIAPGAVLCGHVTVGENTLIGAGAVVIPGCSIAANSVIGAGAVVTADCVESGMYVGNPARLVRKD